SSIVFSICPSHDSDGEFGTMFNANSTGYSSCQSNDSDGDQGTISDHTVQDNPTNIPSIEQVTIATQTTQPQMPEHQQTVDPSCAHGLVNDDTCILSYGICRESALVYWHVEGEYGRDQGSCLGMWKSKMDSLFFSLRNIKIFSSMILKLLWQEMDNIIWVLPVFYLASNLKINIAKSNVHGIRVSLDDIVDMARATGCA
ncbi:hypothetical protein Tco_0046817, partial [Tanacetum coccineum]